MFRSQNYSISKKLTWMNMLVSAIALLMACTAFSIYDTVTFRQNMVHNLSAQAEMVGSNSISALIFNDPQAAIETLSPLKDASNILSAVIYDENGKPFAVYSRLQGSTVPPPPSSSVSQTESYWMEDGQIALARPILFKGKSVGTVCIRSDIGELQKRRKLYFGIAGLVLIVSLLAALLVSSLFKKFVAEPIVRLAELSKKISRDKDYSIRIAPVQGKNELVTLMDAFNEMLEQIQQNKEALQRAHDGLEQRVKERTAELLTAKEEVERTSKFKDQFLSTMSHELRTPLNAVLGFSEMLLLQRPGPLTERQERYVNHIHTGGQHLHRLINDILDISKIEAGRLQLMVENVTVPALFSEVVDALQSLLDKKSQTLTQSAPQDLRVVADPVRLKQILMNLLGNAIKFTPQHGTIELTARSVGNDVRIEVSDSGPGIPPEERGRIFEAFHRIRQSDNLVEGTGLGLAITRSLVELHGGHLGLESEPGSGSCFFFILPGTAPPEKITEESLAMQRSPAVSARIFVIEDDMAASQLLESQLSAAGHEVILCEHPELAVETAALLQPDVITLDIIMKPLNGWQILSSLKGDPRTSAIPVIVISIIDKRDMGTLFGADDYIVKPVDQSVLLGAISRCLPLQQTAILVVEDDTPTREFITEVLSRQGYAVVTASDGTQARRCVQESLPDLVILDLILPEVNGFELLREWRGQQRTTELPVIVLTSKDLTPEEKQYLRENAGSFFSKQEHWQNVLLQRIARNITPKTGDAS